MTRKYCYWFKGWPYKDLCHLNLVVLSSSVLHNIELKIISKSTFCWHYLSHSSLQRRHHNVTPEHPMTTQACNFQHQEGSWEQKSSGGWKGFVSPLYSVHWTSIFYSVRLFHLLFVNSFIYLQKYAEWLLIAGTKLGIGDKQGKNSGANVKEPSFCTYFSEFDMLISC